MILSKVGLPTIEKLNNVKFEEIPTRYSAQYMEDSLDDAIAKFKNQTSVIFKIVDDYLSQY